ncbi:helix-turn-helix domain-containing protein [Bacillus sp. Marseille-P3800]|uniref:helix-turn-helix domain-containing protein n=1 Tax=Bacillus sp. Marseille-P3800 TaxID=2014782 RepID=UPI000C06EB84|nr:helix-turn-helix domain-containing protein [Bacillus sp. Marseille-P3800]
MAKYSDEFKINLVKEYLEGYYGYRLLAKKHKIPDTNVIRRWVRAFQAFGVDGIKRKRKNAVYSVPFKLDVLHYMERTGASLQDTAIVFGLNNPPLIASWKNRYREAGVEGLENPKGRPSTRIKGGITNINDGIRVFLVKRRVQTMRLWRTFSAS